MGVQIGVSFTNLAQPAKTNWIHTPIYGSRESGVKQTMPQWSVEYIGGVETSRLWFDNTDGHAISFLVGIKIDRAVTEILESSSYDCAAVWGLESWSIKYPPSLLALFFIQQSFIPCYQNGICSNIFGPRVWVPWKRIKS
jgi:hypothetical protein